MTKASKLAALAISVPALLLLGYGITFSEAAPVVAAIVALFIVFFPTDFGKEQYIMIFAKNQ